MTKKEIISTVFAGFVGIVFTALYDIIKSKPILSTFWDVLKWIWRNVFSYEVTIWQIIIFIVVSLIIRRIVLVIKGEDDELDNDIKIDEDEPDWVYYIKDKIHGINWEWYWRKDYSGKWSVDDLRPVCDSCGTKMQVDNSPYSRVYAECPRCNKKYGEHRDFSKIEAVIIDNVHRGLYEL